MFRRLKRTSSLLIAAALVACSRKEAPELVEPAAAKAPVRSPVQPANTLPDGLLPAEEQTWRFESSRLGSIPVVVLLPERRPEQRFPVLISMHGRGEALKGPERGARGWVDDYELGRVLTRLASPPLTRDDFFSFVSTTRLARMNRALADQPYRGLIVVCPYTPDALRGGALFESGAALAELFVKELLPRVHRETPALDGALATGVDGVSLGGRAAYAVGLLAPEAFGVVAGIQAAFDVKEIPMLVAKARSANPRLEQSFRLLTSHADFYRKTNEALARAFQGAGLSVTFDVVEGPHDYIFNRGPGAIEMLLFHDRALRGETPL